MKSFEIIIKTTFAVKAVTWIKKKKIIGNLWQENKFQKYTLSVNKFEFRYVNIKMYSTYYTFYSLIVYLF